MKINNNSPAPMKSEEKYILIPAEIVAKWFEKPWYKRLFLRIKTSLKIKNTHTI